LAFGKNSAQARSFPSKDFQNAINSEHTMMAVMEALISLANKYQADGSHHGRFVHYSGILWLTQSRKAREANQSTNFPPRAPVPA
jgi:hypothetical protein